MRSMALAIGDYDHVRDLVEGRVRPEGLDLTCLRLAPEEIFARTVERPDWEAAEFSLALYVNRVGRGDRSLLAIPAFPSRVFRHGSFYARADGPTALEELAGARVGIPEWAQTAGVWARGILAERHGVDLASIRWVQGGVNDPGRREKGRPELPAGIELAVERERSLDRLLRAGELDAVISARPPAGVESGALRRLLADPRAAEKAYWAETGVFPIMHLVVLRADFLAAAPWAAASLHAALDEARARSARRLLDPTASHVPLPWVADLAAESRTRFGGELWPYGIEPNRTTLETFLRHARDQGVADPGLAVEDLFPLAVAPVAV
ncbi:MAG: 4,5-dihydroxyphthalate decarboxylase [Actinobacteria bacterium]|nr:4,5-dihydroxyphthalate decarboxylase [Actinomycetota bacterium]